MKTITAPIQNFLLAARFCGLGLLGVSPMLLASPARAQSTTPQTVRHTFVYVADKPLKSVALTGTFNGWNMGANPMKADADGLTWRLTLPLEFGLHQYKFVLDGSNWITDPKAARNETDAGGNTNSILFLAPPDYARPASPNDGQIASSALRHEMRAPYLNFDRGRLSLSLRVRPRDVQEVRLRSAGQRLPMKLVSQNELYATYRGEVEWNGRQNLSYSFELKDGNRVRDFGKKGLGSAPFQIVAKDFKPFVVPDWVERTVFYQIFPDRFENGDKTNDPKEVQAWDAKPEWFNRFGGDVAGIRQHLPYLKDLGISGVYFNPIFKSPSNHRYDATDFKQIDPEFGTNAEFAALTRDLQKAGIRTVLDFVFNHTATDFGPFADIRKKGAASRYNDWFFIKSYPVKVADPPNYVAWFNYPSMPKLNLMNPETGDYMLDLVNFWKKEVPLAGLRLDVADEVDVRFWRRLRQRTKSLDPQMWIVGERWSDASQWLQGDQWDSAMNYPFLFANVEFFAEGKTSATGFTNRLMEVYNLYPPQVSRNMLNLLSSHDRPRFLTVAKNNARLHQLAAVTQFTWVGAPSIYYGEEIGMEGGADPDNRRGMAWGKATPDNPMLRFYKRLIQIRNGSRALQSGDPAILLADDAKKTFAYSRTLGQEMAVVAINRSDAPQTVEIAMPRSQRFVDALSGKAFQVGSDAKLRVQLAPLSPAILLQNAIPGARK
ncbi:MAG: alpha-glucosidase C-terminal domain-containing protein [Armatimonadetes bacterium]|nr:alpha-glucosidase C-terminal domain-containing protein [Armatimonadota bacterium]